MGSREHSRQPCPDRILDEVGGAFGMGAVGGSVFHFLKGIYNSPKGGRLIGGTQAMRMNVGRVAGGYAVYAGLFSAIDCTMVYIRQKEDPWNSIIAGAATSGLLSMRQGPVAAARSALFGGIMLALIEGSGIMLNKMMAAQQAMQQIEEPVLPKMAAAQQAMQQIEEPLPKMAAVPGYPTGRLPAQALVNVDGSSTSSSSSRFGGIFCLWKEAGSRFKQWK